jgi:hypothetical protein
MSAGWRRKRLTRMALDTWAACAKSYRRPEVAASRAWLESLPRLSQVDVLITTFDEEDEPAPGLLKTTL